MKVSEHPARLPPGVQPPFEDAETRRGRGQAERPPPPFQAAVQDDDDTHEDLGDGLKLASGLTDTNFPAPTREPIDTAPQDGRDVLVFWGDDDAEGRVVRWKQGRYFTGRRWMQGGRWAPSDGTTPLVADAPTHWLKPPGSEDAAAEGAPEAEDESAAA
ncbi:MAG TPA: hypothetical protein VN663_22820 [Ramlibacter sp.]|nr:hypothetical protein [Ramlibacter sp.]